MIAQSCTVFAGAFLLFQIEPLIAKWILPWFGGSPGVWTTAMLVFQALLLAGYAYANEVVRRLDRRGQGRLHAALVALSLAFLPIAPDPRWKPLPGAGQPLVAVVGVLVASVGVPFFLLSATAPLVQSWVARAGARTPYRLYALSNAASLLALVSYPVLVEPALAASRQAALWSAAYLGFAVLTFACALAGAGDDARPVAAARTSSFGDRALWGSLAGTASILLLAITNQICQDVAAIPLLWILPLVLYLASFTLCFEREGWYSRRWFLRGLFIAVAAVSYCIVGGQVSLPAALAVYGSALFVGCMICHGELARAKPEPARLTSFYLTSSAGAALGGFFVAVVAPAVFADTVELQIGLLGCTLLALFCGYRETAAALAPERRRRLRIALAGAAAVVAAALWLQAVATNAGARIVARNFYGILKVNDVSDGGGNARRVLVHGVTRHGMQFLDAARRDWPTTYYGRASGAARALAVLGERGALRVGLVGLGAGTLATYGRAGDVYRFYEINPLVVDLARREFTFLADSAAAVDVVLGDARLALEAEPPQRFDALVLDAFSSDAIPAHLLSREAFAVYARHLRPGGALAFHVTNDFLDLRPVVEAGAATLGWRSAFVRNPTDDDAGAFAADWEIASADPAFLERLGGDPGAGRAVAPWTDEFSDLFRILK